MSKRRRTRQTPGEQASGSPDTPGLRASATASPSLGRAFRANSPDRAADLMAAGDELRVAMERGAARLKELVLKQPPLDLLAYLCGVVDDQRPPSHH